MALTIIFFFFTTTLIFIPASSFSPDDQECLYHLYHSFEDRHESLIFWKGLNFTPCTFLDSPTQSNLSGVECEAGRVSTLRLAYKYLGGQISPQISKCTNLQVLDLSSNYLQGPIPSELQLPNLVFLNLSYNYLSAEIPSQLGYFCPSLYSIDLHNNSIYGYIPAQLGGLSMLHFINVSNNKLVGQIPSFLAKFNSSSFLGNRDLYGNPLGPYRKEPVRWKYIITAIVVGSVIGLFICFFIYLWYCFWSNPNGNGAGEGDGIEMT